MHNFIDLFTTKLPKTFGTALWASIALLRRFLMLKPREGKDCGPIIGSITPEEIGGRETLDVYGPAEGHLLTMGPTGDGKSTGQMIPNLHYWPGSGVVFDLKGDLWLRSAGWRHSQGHRVIRFSPFVEGSATWSPIDEINEGCGSEPIPPNHPVRQENARYLANLMIIPNPKAKDPYWDLSAKSLLTAEMLHVATAPLALTAEERKVESRVRERTMAEVWRLSTLDSANFNDLMKEMAKSEEALVRGAAGIMNQMAPAREQTGSVKTVLAEHLNIWSYSRVQQVTARSSFSFRELRGATPTTIYLIVPPDAMTEYRGLLRVLIGACIRDLARSWREDDANPRVLVMLDEFPQLGYMQPIEDALLYMRSYGVKFWFFVQNTSQLKQHYENSWQQFMANCAVRMFFGVNDIETAELVSKMSGLQTVVNLGYSMGVNESDTTNQSESNGTSKQTGSGGSYSSSSQSGFGPGGGSSSSSSSFTSSWNNSKGESWNQTFGSSRTMGRNFNANLAYVGRPLIMPDEVMRMPFGKMIIFVKGMPPIRAQLRFWWKGKSAEGNMLPPS